MGALTLRGVNGSIRWSYLQAAKVQKWAVAPGKDGSFTLTASVSEANSCHLAQTGLTFVVPIQGGVWVWPIRSLTITGGTLTATLGPLGSPSETRTEGVHEQQNP